MSCMSFPRHGLFNANMFRVKNVLLVHPLNGKYLSEAATVRNESVATFFAPFEADAVVCQHG